MRGDFIYLISITITTALLRLDVPSQLLTYETGEIEQGSQYFKQLSRTIIEYANNLESKFDGNIGVLERKHVQADSVVYIGKEANNIDEQELDVKQAQVFVDVREIMRKILEIPQKEAEKLGVGRSTFQGIKEGIRESRNVNLDTPAMKRLMEKSN